MLIKAALLAAARARRSPGAEVLRGLQLALEWAAQQQPPHHHLQRRGARTRAASELRPGNVVEHGGRLLEVVRQSHNQQGRQLAVVQLEARDLRDRSKHQLRLRPAEQLAEVRLEERELDFLYREGGTLHFMDATSFEQLAVDAALFGAAARFLAGDGGVTCTLRLHGGEPVGGALPHQLELRVVEAAPTMKGETAAPSYKRAVVAGGAEVQVPPFVVAGDAVVVDTRDGTFVRRA